VQQLDPGVPTAYLTIQTPNSDNVGDPAWTGGLRLADHGSVPRMVKAAGGATWSPNAGALTEALVREAQSLGLKVVPWTVNEPADMDRLISWGVDGLITDYPDRLRTVLARRGLPLPAPAPRPAAN
jgi:glycerophosphoryl diester phosphodiesterase